MVSIVIMVSTFFPMLVKYSSPYESIDHKFIFSYGQRRYFCRTKAMRSLITNVYLLRYISLYLDVYMHGLFFVMYWTRMPPLLFIFVPIDIRLK